MKIFLTGATGFVGSHMLRRLLNEGHTVVASARSPASEVALRTAGATPWIGRIEPGAALLQALQGCDAIVHCAAHLKMWGAWHEFEASNVGLTRTLLDAARQSGIRHFIHISAGSVVLQAPGPMLDADESAPLTSRRELPYSSTKAEAELLVLQAAGPALRTLALRPPLIWGPGDIFDRELGERIEKGQFGWFGGGHYPYVTCHIDNLCEATILALASGASGIACFVTDGGTVDLRGFMTRRIEARGLPVPRMSMPRGLAWAVAAIAETLWRGLGLGGEPPLTRETLRLIAYPFSLKSDRAFREIGYRPVTTIDQGLERLTGAGRTARA